MLSYSRSRRPSSSGLSTTFFPGGDRAVAQRVSFFDSTRIQAKPARAEPEHQSATAAAATDSTQRAGNPQVNSELVSELKTDRGGLRVEIPLTRGLLSWVEDVQRGQETDAAATPNAAKLPANAPQ